MRAGVVLAVMLVASPFVVAQEIGTPNPDFDLSRLRDSSGRFTPYHVADTERLGDVLAAGTVTENTPVLITETAAGPLAFVTDQMSFHHIAQGDAAGEPWMVTF